MSSTAQDDVDAKHESEVREALDAVWTKPAKSEELAEVAEKNTELYEFERMLEKSLSVLERKLTDKGKNS